MDTLHPRAAQVLAFWFRGDDRDPRWFAKAAEFDAEIRDTFLPVYDEAAQGAFAPWIDAPRECLALILLLDQFPRNMFRGSARAFATDAHALAAAKEAVRRGHDRSMRPCERMFLYLPFQHAESLEEQRASISLNAPLGEFPETFDVPRFAAAHLAIIERFGRFPHRNAALGRPSTAEEVEFLKQPGSGF
ncbi:MAG TPA: DUF924 family protein [Burkholderiales bacterium]|nr:DUF924 family protein [Burkholderiales bacterium]